MQRTGAAGADYGNYGAVMGKLVMAPNANTYANANATRRHKRQLDDGGAGGGGGGMIWDNADIPMSPDVVMNWPNGGGGGFGMHERPPVCHSFHFTSSFFHSVSRSSIEFIQSFNLLPVPLFAYSIFHSFIY